MTDHDRLDELLTECLTDLPPEDIVNDVTPWRMTMRYLFWGLALPTVTFNFLWLQYILPAIGLTLCLLGFRALRRENRWLGACFGLTVVRAAAFLTQLISHSTVWRSESLTAILTNSSALLAASTFFCLWRGLRLVRQKAGLEPGAGPALALLVWYLILYPLARVGYQGFLLPIALLICYGFLLYNLYRLFEVLETAGYTLDPGPVRFSDKQVSLALLVVLAVGLVLGYCFGGQHPMDWQVREAAQQQEVEDIKAHLLELDFPAAVLADLTAEDILQCKDALRVYSEVDDQSIIKSRELRITGVAVQLPGERETWKLIHHFQWIKDPGFWGTEAVRLRPDWVNNTWSPVRDAAGQNVSGRVLMDRDGAAYTAPYWSLALQEHAAMGFPFVASTETSTFAAFSFPKQAENRRGYLTHTIQRVGTGRKIYSWFDYTHQLTWRQYPVQSAAEYTRTSLWENEIFRSCRDSIVFSAKE